MNPTVCAILLTADRPELTKKAVQSFRAQTYENKRLLIYDTGKVPIPPRWFFREEILSGHEAQGIYYEYHPEDRGLTIGALRNLAMAFAHPLCLNADIIVTWDSDDWSHPNRITEQVALLQAGGADCVGYNEMLFWKSWPGACMGHAVLQPDNQIGFIEEKQLWPPVAEAWLYTNHRPNFALGTSLCYWRKTWEARPFEDIPRPGDMEGEDGRFIRGLNVAAVSGLPIVSNGHTAQTLPMMVARIHGGNSSDQYRDIAQSDNWKRVLELDNRLREILK